TTLRGDDTRDFGYLGIFMLGAVLGLAGFVKILKYSLHNHRWLTLIIRAGMMFKSLRALWRSQSAAAVGADGEPPGAAGLLAPTDPVLVPILLAVLGAVVVIALIIVEARSAAAKDQTSPGPDEGENPRP